MYNLQRQLRANPELHAIDAVTRDEILVLHALSQRFKKGSELDVKQSIGTFLVETAGLVGFYPSKSQSMLGTESVWHGWQRLKSGVAGFQVVMKKSG